jgi:hypothetical protein
MTKSDAPKDLAALNAMLGGLDGTLPGTHPDLAEDAAQLADGMLPLLGTMPEIEPPADLFAAIEAKIDGLDDAVIRTTRAEEGKWVQRNEKVWMKVLSHEPETGRMTYLLRCLPGARIEGHAHERSEHMFVLEGELWIDGVLYRAGDAQMALPGTVHADATMPSGCLVIVNV